MNNFGRSNNWALISIFINKFIIINSNLFKKLKIFEIFEFYPIDLKIKAWMLFLMVSFNLYVFNINSKKKIPILFIS